MNRKLKCIALVVALLMSASLMSTCSAARRSMADFSLSSSGTCLVIGTFGNLPGELPFGLGTGALNVVGTSDAELLEVSDDPPGSLYAATRYFRITQQSVNVAWEGHSVNVRFIVRDTNGAEYIDNNEIEQGVPRDYIYLGDFFGPSYSSMLVYRGTHTDATGTHSISGEAIIFTEPFEEGVDVGTYILMVLFDNKGGFLEVAWFSIATDISFDSTPLPIPAATQVLSQVTIK